MCRNDELSSTISCVGCLLPDSELFILFAENSQILLKIYSHSLNFHVSGSPEYVSKQTTQLIVELNSLLRYIIVTYKCRFSTQIVTYIFTIKL